ncbi:ImmA/IrrE family metallo-endopeptidase [Candidatus Electronema sp. JM]|uniref:ImmA/IrrE family metallo-endopeptidase n=1 Tax=Candidatus Electronema sp. JM TaxID=3401571 RepID=UPI003AA8D816
MSYSQKVPMVQPLSREKIENDSLLFLQKHHPEPLRSDQSIDIEYIFELIVPQIQPDIKTGYFDLSSFGTGVMGFTDAARKISYVHNKLYDAALQYPCSPEARRFRATVAHEVSHCICHYSYLKTFKSICSLVGVGNTLMRRRSDIPPYMDPEWQAWEQAGALLMAEAIYRRIDQKRKKYQ